MIFAGVLSRNWFVAGNQFIVASKIKLVYL